MAKRGRKTDNPKPYRMAVKYDEKCKRILEEYCAANNVNMMEAARRGIMLLGGESGEPPRLQSAHPSANELNIHLD